MLLNTNEQQFDPSDPTTFHLAPLVSADPMRTPQDAWSLPPPEEPEYSRQDQMNPTAMLWAGTLGDIGRFIASNGQQPMGNSGWKMYQQAMGFNQRQSAQQQQLRQQHYSNQLNYANQQRAEAANIRAQETHETAQAKRQKMIDMGFDPDLPETMGVFNFMQQNPDHPYAQHLKRQQDQKQRLTEAEIAKAYAEVRSAQNPQGKSLDERARNILTDKQFGPEHPDRLWARQHLGREQRTQNPDGTWAIRPGIDVAGIDAYIPLPGSGGPAAVAPGDPNAPPVPGDPNAPLPVGEGTVLAPTTEAPAQTPATPAPTPYYTPGRDEAGAVSPDQARYEKGAAAYDEVRGSIAKLQALVDENGVKATALGPVGATLQSMHSALLVQIKDMAELGALDAADLAVVEGIIGNPISATNAINPMADDAYKARLRSALQWIDDRSRKFERQFEGSAVRTRQQSAGAITPDSPELNALPAELQQGIREGIRDGTITVERE